MAQKEVKLSPELKKEIVELAISAYRKEAERQKAYNRDRRLHNTELLLEKYRSFVVHSQSAVFDATQVEDDEEFYNLMELMDSSSRGLAVESVRESAARTRILVHHVTRMLDFFEHCCQMSKKPEDLRRLRVIHALYIDDDRKTPEEIAQAENVDVRTIYRDKKFAVKQLSALLFGYFE